MVAPSAAEEAANQRIGSFALAVADGGENVRKQPDLPLAKWNGFAGLWWIGNQPGGDGSAKLLDAGAGERTDF
jgi:hypothetical protein